MPKPTELTIDDKTYKLGFNYNDLCDAEPVTGCNLLSALGRATRDLTATELRGLFYAMIAPPADAPRLKDGSLDQGELLKYCGNLMRLDTIGDIRYAVTEAFARSVNDEIGDEIRKELHEAPTNQAEQSNTLAKEG